MSRRHELSESRVSEDGVVRETDAGDVEVHQLGAVVVACVEGDREADLPQRVSSSTTHSREGLAEAEPLEWHVEKAEGFYREQVDVGMM